MDVASSISKLISEKFKFRDHAACIQVLFQYFK